METIFRVENLRAKYENKEIFSNVSFSLKEGEVLVIIGQNGCGKSTLLKSLSRDLKSGTGNIMIDEVLLNNKCVWDLKENGISWMVQGGMIFPTMTIREHLNIAFLGKGKKEVSLIMEECKNCFPSLFNDMSLLGGNLSGGQRQILSFALLISQQTKLWFLDEPTAGLSPKIVNDSIQFLDKMKRSKKQTMIIVEHNYDAAFQIADYVAVLKGGTLSPLYKQECFKDENFLETYLFN